MNDYLNKSTKYINNFYKNGIDLNDAILLNVVNDCYKKGLSHLECAKILNKKLDNNEIPYKKNMDSIPNDENNIVTERLITNFKDYLKEGIEQVIKNNDGTITYRDEKFDGFNKPKKYDGNGNFKKRVLAKEGDEIKIINYGHKDYEDYTIHKDPKRRKNFRSRHKCDPVKNLSKLSKKYWACQDLW